MPELAFLNQLRDRSTSDAAAVVHCFERLNALAEIRTGRPLIAAEIAELASLRLELRNRLANWLEKR